MQVLNRILKNYPLAVSNTYFSLVRICKQNSDPSEKQGNEGEDYPLVTTHFNIIEGKFHKHFFNEGMQWKSTMNSCNR